MLRSQRSTRTLFAIAIALVLLPGCSGGTGPQRYRLSGAITYDGQPVPAGWIIFTPTAGPGATANIEGGRYETPPGFGTIGGLHTVEVVAFDGHGAGPDAEGGGTFGKPLFRRTFQREFPPQATAIDFALSSKDL